MKINLDRAALAFIAGSTSLLISANLITTEIKIVILVLLVLGSVFAYGYRLHLFWYPIVFLLSGFLWSFHIASLKSNGARPWVDKRLLAIGTVTQINLHNTDTALPTGFQQISFAMTAINGKPLPAPVAIILSWRPASAIPILAGQRWQIDLISHAIHANLNEGSFDLQRFFASKGIFLRGRVLRANLVTDSPSFRQRVISDLVRKLHPYSQSGLMIALLFGERDRISQLQRLQLNNAGIAHLMAISGLHVLLVAAFILRALKWFCRLLPPFNAIPVLLISSLVGASCYVFLAGMNPPALRALLGFGGYVVVKLQKVQIAKSSCLIRFMALLIACNPLFVLSDSFWLSCFAAASILFLYCWFPMVKLTYFRWLKSVLALVHLQLGLSILLLPMQIYLFNGISIGGLWANLVAVPLTSLAIMPLLIISMLLFLCQADTPASYVSMAADWLLNLVMYVAQQAAYFWLDTSHHWIYAAFIGWIGILIIKTEWWRHFKLTLALLLFLLFGPFLIQNPVRWQVDMLDVGQGLAIIIRQNKEAIIYDCGPKYRTSSQAEKQIIPFLRWHNLTPHSLILSHEHSDHIGGYARLKKEYPHLNIISSSLAFTNVKKCIAGQKWQWHKLHFEVLWPLTLSQHAVDRHSCVICISDGKFNLLLTGDLRHQQEQQIVARYTAYPNTILQVPHHGSYSASSLLFLRWLHPILAINSAARYNRWRLPATKTIKRYHALSIPILSTHQEGQISLYFFKNHWSYATLRHTIKSRWYHDWFGALNKYG